MNLTKAIQLNKESYQSLADHGFHDHADAIKLSNEAVKRLEQERTLHTYPAYKLLPGETKE